MNFAKLLLRLTGKIIVEEHDRKQNPWTYNNKETTLDKLTLLGCSVFFTILGLTIIDNHVILGTISTAFGILAMFGLSGLYGATSVSIMGIILFIGHPIWGTIVALIGITIMLSISKFFTSIFFISLGILIFGSHPIWSILVILIDVLIMFLTVANKTSAEKE